MATADPGREREDADGESSEEADGKKIVTTVSRQKQPVYLSLFLYSHITQP